METGEHQAGHFPTTRWSLVVAGGAGGGDGEAEERGREALEELCKIYWVPVYAFVRGRGYQREDAEDLTQGFFQTLLERGTFAMADREKGRMRSFLRVAVKRYLFNQDARRSALKRGGGTVSVPMEVDGLEARLADVSGGDPEQSFDRRWAMALLEDVVARLQAVYREQGRDELFAVLKATLSVDGTEMPGADLAMKLGMTDGAVRVALYRLRKRYREMLRAAIAQTVADASEVDSEIRYLMTLFASNEQAAAPGKSALET